MTEYFGKFITAFLGLAIACLLISGLVAIVLGVVIGWAWAISFLPLWAKWVASVFFCMVIIAAIAAAQDQESRW